MKNLFFSKRILPKKCYFWYCLGTAGNVYQFHHCQGITGIAYGITCNAEFPILLSTYTLIERPFDTKETETGYNMSKHILRYLQIKLEVSLESTVSFLNKFVNTKS